MKKNCLIYANCQGEALLKIINKSSDFNENYKTEHIFNFVMIANKTPLPIDVLKTTDLFIYQPVNELHGIYSTSHMMGCLPDRCRTLSFPYLYNNALWPLIRNKDGNIENEKIIIGLLEKGMSLIDIIIEFLSFRIDFNFKERFQSTMDRLVENELATTIKSSQYILENYKNEKLFITQNHPTSDLVLYCTNQILKLLEYPLLGKNDITHPNEAGLPGYYPHSPYERRFYQFTYEDNWRDFCNKKKEGNWKHFYLRSIIDICLRYRRAKNTSYYFEKFSGKLLRSFTKFI